MAENSSIISDGEHDIQCKDIVCDVSDISDLPDEVIATMTRTHGDKNLSLGQKTIKELFETNRSLSIDQVIAGYYRITKEIKPRRWFRGNLFILAKKGILEKPEKRGGNYKINDTSD